MPWRSAAVPKRHQYYYVVWIALISNLSCIPGQATVNTAPKQASPSSSSSSASIRLANGYVPLILSKSPLQLENPASHDNPSNTVVSRLSDSFNNLILSGHFRENNNNSSKPYDGGSNATRNTTLETSPLVPLLAAINGRKISSTSNEKMVSPAAAAIIWDTQSSLQQKSGIRGGSIVATTPPNSLNVIDLTRNLEALLKNIRNVELGVTYAQEIFDALDFTLVDRTSTTGDDSSNRTAIVARLATRIRNKLELAHDILTNLSEYISSNASSMLQRSQQQQSNHSRKMSDSIFLNTIIQPCPFDDFTLEQNYNKKQIKILNYLKINGYNDANDLSFAINTQIIDALRKTGPVGSSATTTTTTTTSNSNSWRKKFEQYHDANKNESIVNGSLHRQASKNSSAATKTPTAMSNFKHVFFLSAHDHGSDHNCQYYFNDLNFRRLFVDAIDQKHVFLLVDQGNSLTIEQLDLSKQFVSNVIQMLSSTDTLTIVLLDSQAKAIQLRNNQNDMMTFRYNATMDRKNEFLRIISQLVPSKEITNHTLGFQYSFEILYRQNLNGSKPMEFVYVTRGLLSSFAEAMNVLQAVTKGQAKLKSPIVINTCAVILDEKRIMYEKQFLQDIAQQNYSKYNINVSEWYNAKKHQIHGQMFIVTKRHSELIVKTSTAIFSRFYQTNYVSDKIRYHLPTIDYNTKDIIVAITKPISQFGLTGINMYLNDLAEDIINYHKLGDSYAFLIDIAGYVIYHPAFSRPIAMTKTPYPVRIELLEPALLKRSRRYPLKTIRSRILHEIIGEEESIKIHNSSDDMIERNLTYVWYRILHAYIVCIVANENSETSTNNQFDHYDSNNIDTVTSSELLYHRIDLIPPQTPVCRHFRQIATLDTGTIFLSAAAFKSPFMYYKNNREIKDEIQRMHNAQSIMAYIKDMTNLLANPGLQPSIRNQVSALLQVMSYLKKRHLENGPMKKYIIRRYIATTNGILQVYPGCILGVDLEPSRRPWFRRAIRYPGRIVLTEPYLDAGGAGYIITIAHTIFEGKANALHNAEINLPIAVIAIDVPYGFIYKIMLESTPICTETNIKCLLLQDQGYLLAHPSIMESATQTQNARRPLEHITHKESFVANDMLNHKYLVRKKACATYENRIVQRSYEFNTSLTQILSNNVVHGERTRYQITSIPGTNMFAAILNSSCDGGAFCPCSTVDRICLNCNRMDQMDCECPCECPLNISEVDRQETASVATASILDYCEPAIEDFSVVNSLSYDWSLIVKSCMNINCELYATHMDCLGVMGCEWCQLDVDLNPFAVPFCTGQNSCFNGVLGSSTPYGDVDLGSAIIEATTTKPAYSAIGPVGGAIIALCLVIGFAMYCYRQNLDSGTEHLYGGDSMQDDNYGVPLSRFNFDDITPHDDSDLNGGGETGIGGAAARLQRNLLHPLANVLTLNEVSPYHVSSSGYRRPVNGESDHGYSTMTPHEDSEHMCFTLVEPLINGQHKLMSMSADSMSINTSVSSPSSQLHSHSPPVPMGRLLHHTPQLIAIDRPPPSLQPSNMRTNHSAAAAGKHNLDIDSGIQSSLISSSTLCQTVLPEDCCLSAANTTTTTTAGQTSPHHILAPVTVHRHMEAS